MKPELSSPWGSGQVKLAQEWAKRPGADGPIELNKARHANSDRWLRAINRTHSRCLTYEQRHRVVNPVRVCSLRLSMELLAYVSEGSRSRPIIIWQERHRTHGSARRPHLPWRARDIRGRTSHGRVEQWTPGQPGPTTAICKSCHHWFLHYRATTTVVVEISLTARRWRRQNLSASSVTKEARENPQTLYVFSLRRYKDKQRHP